MKKSSETDQKKSKKDDGEKIVKRIQNLKRSNLIDSDSSDDDVSCSHENKTNMVVKNKELNRKVSELILKVF